MGCTHNHPGARFDPGECPGSCPVCYSTVGADLGQPVAQHQKPGSREMCPGSGQSAV
ncbi:hypothetical protein SAMN04487983_10659 [Streptomyces sp. yr375]|nr:hypothetical protein SAMN04487983_10659 [Streptomyces sp. yr375]